MSASSYLRGLSLAVALALGTVAAGVAIVDPYSLFDWITVKGFNAEKPNALGRARLSKPLVFSRRPYNGVVFGDSRVEQGIDPAFEGLRAKGIALYNFGLSGLLPYEAANLLDYAVDAGRIEFAVVSLEFGRYEEDVARSGGRYLPLHWTPRSLAGELFRALFTLDAIADSIETVAGTDRFFFQHLADGRLNTEKLEAGRVNFEMRRIFDETDRNYLLDYYRWYLAPDSGVRKSGFAHSSLRKMLRTAREAGTKLFFVISPSSASQLEVIYLLGLWHAFEIWRAELACLVDEETAGGNAARVEFWDFSGYNMVTTEPVPSVAEPEIPMQFYFDPVHYRPRVGNAMLNRMLKLNTKGYDGFSDFGIRVTTDNALDHSRAVREQRRKYLQRNPDLPNRLRSFYPAGRPLPDGRFEYPPSDWCRPVEWLRQNPPE